MTDGKKLPTSGDDPSVLRFLELWDLKDPVFLDYEDVGSGYEPDFCHVSAKHVAAQCGGRRVHGWALWQYDAPPDFDLPIIFGNFHSVWETPSGELKDVTPPKVGSRVLFVRDAALVIRPSEAGQLLYNTRTNVPRFPRVHAYTGDTVDEDTFSMNGKNTFLVEYCRKLGINPDTSML